MKFMLVNRCYVNHLDIVLIAALNWLFNTVLCFRSQVPIDLLENQQLHFTTCMSTPVVHSML